MYLVNQRPQNSTLSIPGVSTTSRNVDICLELLVSSAGRTERVDVACRDGEEAAVSDFASSLTWI